MVKEPIAEIYAAMAEIAASDLSPTEKLRRAMLCHLEGFDRHYPHMVVYMHECEEMKRIYRDRLNLSPKQYEGYWQRILREGIRSGEFRADLDVKVASYAVLGMLNGAYKWYDPRGRLGCREVADQFSKLALAGLMAAKPRTSPDKRARRQRAHK